MTEAVIQQLEERLKEIEAQWKCHEPMAMPVGTARALLNEIQRLREWESCSQSPAQLKQVIQNLTEANNRLETEQNFAAAVTAAAFEETIQYYNSSPKIGAQFAVVVLQGLRTRIEQEIANQQVNARRNAPASSAAAPVPSDGSDTPDSPNS